MIIKDIYYGLQLLHREGVKSFTRRLFLYLRGRDPIRHSDKTYPDFLKKQKLNRKQLKDLLLECQNFEYRPLISVVIPVYNVSPKWLNKCINSVFNQYYQDFEICIHDDASTNQKTINCLKRWSKHPKVKVSFGKKNQHISGASNAAIKLAKGEFIALLDNDDEITKDALYQVVKCLNQNSKLDFIYSDEDKMEMNGKRVDPVFKPDFSIDYLLCCNYLCHFSVIRKSVGDKLGWFRKGTEGAQDYDLFLRVIEVIPEENIYHIPKVLYSWRKIPGSTAVAYSEKSYAYAATLKVLNDYAKRNKIRATIEAAKIPGTFRLKRLIISEPLISIIIPFKDKVELLKKCVLSLLYSTDYKNFEIILVSNNSTEPETFEFLGAISKNHSNVTWYEDNRPFNFSQLNNEAVKKAKGEYVLFLNNDTEVINAEWLTSMVEHIQRDEVGAVGAKLLYPNGYVQHAGVIMGIGGVAGHYNRFFNPKEHGYAGRVSLVQNLSACTGACLLVKKNLFLEVEGFDEVNFKVAFNDVDLCLKIREKGYLVVYTPYAELYHYESISRGSDELPENKPRFMGEVERMRNKWPDVIARDPYYNPNLTLDREDCGLKF